MAFKRKETVIEATDLNTIDAAETEKRIIAGVKKYATNEANWSSADANTPFLGHIIGMGIESSNLADITMSIERQFLTKKTTRVPVGANGEFRLEDGELGKLRILDGQDALAATPGLSVKMLMDFGHMASDPAYLERVVSFAYISVVGDGHKMNEALKKAVSRAEKLTGVEKDEAAANVKTLAAQALAYEALLADPAALAEARQKSYAADKAAHEALSSELTMAVDKLAGATTSNDAGRVAALRTEEAEIKTRLKMSAAKLRVSAEVAAQAGKRSAAEEAKVAQIRTLLSETIRLSGC
ncbi:MAG: hypothetical protein HYZ75_11975 [Elusimicrobia bacterium]|nr:hypothetical protein [Elusimicrobiota bacterium]